MERETRQAATKVRPGGRLRRTVVIDSAAFARRMAQAVEAECGRQQSGRSPLCEPSGLAPNTPAALSLLRDQLGALLRAFIDAARPAGGLPLRPDGTPVDLAALLAAGHAAARDGQAGPGKFERNLRAGRPVDLRLALAALAFLRLATGLPLRLHEIGAIESERMRSARRIEQTIREASEGLSEAVVEALLRRNDEAAAYPFLWDRFECVYSDLALCRDDLGVVRIRCTRVQRYRALKLVSFEHQHRPVLTYEWYEWSRYTHARLHVWQVHEGGFEEPPVEVPVVKRLDADRGLVLFEPDFDAHPGLRALLHSPPRTGASPPPMHVFEWRERLLLNAADRDILVAYAPVHQPEVRFDAAANPEFDLVVGDSPGLDRTDTGWRLERTLAPREVLAVRIRWRHLTPADALRVSPAGEWRPSGFSTSDCAAATLPTS